MITDAPFWQAVQRQPENLSTSVISFLIPILLGETDGINICNISSSKDVGVVVSNNTTTHEPIHDDGNNPHNSSSNNSNVFDFSNMDLSGTNEITLQLLQNVLMYMTPMNQLRYMIPAMSISWNSSCVIEDETNRVITYGAITHPVVSNKTKYKSCLCGDTFLSLLTSQGDVLLTGHTETTQRVDTPRDTHILRKVAGKVIMLAGQGSKLLVLTTANTVRPISVIPANTKTIIPYRLCKYLTCGLSDDSFMVGVDNVLYKTTTSHRVIGTPRRVMTMCRVGISRVASGAGFVFAIDLCGRLYSLGKNKRGQLGNNKHQDSMRKPFLHTKLVHHFFTQVVAGDYHAAALASSGDVYTCGNNEHGQLGLGDDVKEALELTRVPLPTKCVGIAAGPSSTLFACADGYVYACGLNNSELLGVEKTCASKIVAVPQRMQEVEHGVYMMPLEIPGSVMTNGVRENNAVTNASFTTVPKTRVGCCCQQ